MSKFEPTLLPFNKNNDNVNIVYEKINLNKSVVDDLCRDNDLDSNLLILAATCITLTKYVNTTEIFIRVDDVPLIFDDEERDKAVFDYINDVQKYLGQSKDVDEESFFNIVFGDYDDGNAEGITLFVCKDSLRLKYDSNKYTYPYITSFLRSIKKVISQFGVYGINELKIKDICLRDEDPVPEFKLKRNPLVNELLEEQANKTPNKIALRNCGKNYTFKEINDEANRIANALIKRGFKEGDSVSGIEKCRTYNKNKVNIEDTPYSRRVDVSETEEIKYVPLNFLLFSSILIFYKKMIFKCINFFS